jgi:hypothetical protein
MWARREVKKMRTPKDPLEEFGKARTAEVVELEKIEKRLYSVLEELEKTFKSRDVLELKNEGINFEISMKLGRICIEGTFGKYRMESTFRLKKSFLDESKTLHSSTYLYGTDTEDGVKSGMMFVKGDTINAEIISFIMGEVGTGVGALENEQRQEKEAPAL